MGPQVGWDRISGNHQGGANSVRLMETQVPPHSVFIILTLLHHSVGNSVWVTSTSAVSTTVLPVIGAGPG